MSDITARRRIVLSNLPLDSTEVSAKTEPAVEVLTDALITESLFGGSVKKTPVGTVSSIPASNEGWGLPPFADVPGSGVVLPGGINVYFMDLAPGAVSPMHRTTSVDYVAINQGTPTLITPKTSFNVENEKGTFEEVNETLLNPGDVAVQRGAMHAWANRTEEWVHMIGVVVSAEPSKITVGEDVKELGEKWLQ